MFDPLLRAHRDWIMQGISQLLDMFDGARKADKTLVASAVQRHVTALDFAAETWHDAELSGRCSMAQKFTV